jgi:enoyl-CoA hydratase/carnithine racemase
MIIVQQKDKTTLITLNRPDKANALTEQMLQDLCNAVDSAEGQHGLILTGSGKVFSAGADLKAARNGLALSTLWEELSFKVAQFKGMSIAALNGTIAGGANGMAIACDIRLAAPHAKFFYPVMKLGILPQASDPIRMQNLIGPTKAKLLIMAGEKISASTALDWGLVDYIVESEDLIERAFELLSDCIHADLGHVKTISKLFK